MFAEECRKIGEEFPDVAYQEMMVDTFAMRLAMTPQRFDVVVTTNMFGDILSDEAAGLVGGLGLAPGLCAGTRWAMAQATHGSAPDIAGQGIANPIGQIWCGAMMLEFLGHKKAHDAILSTIEKVLAPQSGAPRTPDIGGNASTSDLGKAIAEAL
jgi:3-isopropylmalate dehydrogenase